MALAETPDPAQCRHVFGLRMGQSQPLVFDVSGWRGDWGVFRVPFSTPFSTSPDQFPLRLLTDSNHGRAAAMTIMADHTDLSPASLYTLWALDPSVVRPTIGGV